MIISIKSKLKNRGGLSFAFLCLFSCVVVVLVEVCRVEVAAFYLPFVRVLSCLW